MSEESPAPRRGSLRTRLTGLIAAVREDRALRRRAVAAACALLALLAFVVIPGYLTSRPDFVLRYADVAGQHVTWARSVHAQTPCSGCHARPDVVSQVVWRARMLGGFYVSLVSGGSAPDAFATPTNAACSGCHIDLRTVSPKGDLNIPHRAHVNVLKLSCVRCHRYLVHEKSPEGRHTPTMAGCLTCHDGKQAKDACSACHTEKAAPVSHRAADWTVVHAKRQEGGRCESCHKWRADWCAECHSRRPRSHAGKWRSTHGERLAKRRNCEACHEPRFCVTCHGVYPKDRLVPGLTLVR